MDATEEVVDTGDASKVLVDSGEATKDAYEPTVDAKILEVAPAATETPAQRPRHKEEVKKIKEKKAIKEVVDLVTDSSIETVQEPQGSSIETVTEDEKEEGAIKEAKEVEKESEKVGKTTAVKGMKVINGEVEDEKEVVTKVDAPTSSELTAKVLDAELSATDNELNSVLKSLKRNRRSSGEKKVEEGRKLRARMQKEEQEPFHGWSSVPPRARTGWEEVGGREEELEQQGANFGLPRGEPLLFWNEEGHKSLLEVVMSPPVQQDVGSVERESGLTVQGLGLRTQGWEGRRSRPSRW